MNGHKFEYKCARMLRRKGFHHVEVTKKSGDQGVDIIAYKHFSKFAVLSGIFPDSGWASWLAGLGELDVKYFSWSTVPFP